MTEQTGHPKTKTRGTCIIVDDEDGILKLWARALERESYIVETFDDAHDAYERALTNDLTCIIIDLNMPGVSAPTFTRMVRREGHVVPVIWISGNVEQQDRDLARNLMATYIHDKTEVTTQSDIAKAVADVVDHSSISRDLRAVVASNTELRGTVDNLAVKVEAVEERIFTKEQIVEAVKEGLVASVRDEVIEKIGPTIKDKAKVAVSESWWFRAMFLAVLSGGVGMALIKVDVASIRDSVNKPAPISTHRNP